MSAGAASWFTRERDRNDLVFLDAHIDPDEHVYPMSINGGALNDMVLEKEESS